jgi:thiol-disulfide isomerase/thioredoxin
VEAVVVVAVLWGLQAYQTRKLLTTGEAAPPLSLHVLGAEDAPMPTWSLEATAGKPRLLYFWAPWCGVCNQMTGTISALRRDLEGKAEVVSVACAYKSVAQVRDYVREHGVDYPVLLAEPDTAERFHVSAFPTFYVVSASGEVTSRTLGFTTSWGLRARLW